MRAALTKYGTTLRNYSCAWKYALIRMATDMRQYTIDGMRARVVPTNLARGNLYASLELRTYGRLLGATLHCHLWKVVTRMRCYVLYQLRKGDHGVNEGIIG